ncbi:hypothetical protein BV25DRAFT_1918619 [Artomyces pyxidatus]|uniref:Uncharacterized protein n=1 Tax=Artomyces pyxidatus TaxID=48021 RepID=A0ACB8SUP4_9AGAM|nr:hypothetical protein BV25DRAFT_1918619 [Artomyces pyxidatus]
MALPLACSHKSTGESYYKRHREARRTYQSLYSTVKRQAGRRKISKRARGIKESDIRNELTGRSRSYIDSLSYRSREREPGRTDAMAVKEGQLFARCSDAESEVRDTNPDLWIPSYIERLQTILAEQLSEAHSFVAGKSDHGDNRGGNDSECLQRVHAHRRLVAGVHQEIEIIGQGVEARSLAVMDRAFVLQGCRLNKIAFRSLYGF